MSAETESWFLGPGGERSWSTGTLQPTRLVPAPNGQVELPQGPALPARLALDLEQGQEAGWVTASSQDPAACV